jgi:hypothetical protein
LQKISEACDELITAHRAHTEEVRRARGVVSLHFIGHKRFRNIAGSVAIDGKELASVPVHEALDTLVRRTHAALFQ